MTFVWINPEGQFLVISELHSHLGKQVHISYTDDLDRATVQYSLPATLKDLELIPIPAVATRKVTLKKAF